MSERGVKYHHRWERLVLIEVRGRAGIEADLRSLSVGRQRERKVCGDCQRVHFELFEVGEGAYEIWVREVVQRWMKWCGVVLG